MLRYPHQRVLMRDDDLRQHAVDAATASRRGGDLCGALAVGPLHEERAGDAVADLEARHARGHGQDLAGAVRERNLAVHIAAAAGPVLPAHDEQIPLVERGRAHAHQHLTGLRGCRLRDGLQRKAKGLPVTFELILANHRRLRLCLQRRGGRDDKNEGDFHARHCSPWIGHSVAYAPVCRNRAIAPAALVTTSASVGK
jgi:hypothetical protein